MPYIIIRYTIIVCTEVGKYCQLNHDSIFLIILSISWINHTSPFFFFLMYVLWGNLWFLCHQLPCWACDRHFVFLHVSYGLLPTVGPIRRLVTLQENIELHLFNVITHLCFTSYRYLSCFCSCAFLCGNLSFSAKSYHNFFWRYFKWQDQHV